MQFICYPKCTTCKKAQKWLDDNGFKYQFRDIKAENPTKEELKSWYETSSLPLKRFFNTSGLQYRSLNLKEKLANMTEEEQINLLATDGMLIKRPIIIYDEVILLGFKQAEWEAHLNNKRGANGK